MSGRHFAAAMFLATLALPASAQEGARRRGFEVRVTAPKNGDVVFGRSKITAEVRLERPADLDRVEFSVDDRVIFVDREAPYEALFDFGEESRSWIVRATAFLREDDLSVSETIVTRKIDISFFEEVNRVLMWATVVDREDRPVSDRLEEKDFRVFEDGIEVPLAEFSLEDRPIAIAMLLDSSGSMRDQTWMRKMRTCFDDLFIHHGQSRKKNKGGYCSRTNVQSQEVFFANRVPAPPTDSPHAGWRVVHGISGLVPESVYRRQDRSLYPR